MIDMKLKMIGTLTKEIIDKINTDSNFNDAEKYISANIVVDNNGVFFSPTKEKDIFPKKRLDCEIIVNELFPTNIVRRINNYV